MYKFLVVLIALLVVCNAKQLRTQCFNPGSKVHQASSRPVKLLQGNWLGAEIDTKIAEILINDKLGIPVEVVAVQPEGQAAVFPLTNDGTVDAMLECWPSEHVTDKVTYTNVDWSNELGVEGKLGWYIPKVLTDAHPELATVAGLQSAAASTYLSTPDSNGKAAILNGGTEGEPWINFIDNIVSGLGLNVQKVFGNDGSEDAHIAAIGAAVAAGTSVNPGIPRMFFFYEPNAAFAVYDLTPVALPGDVVCGDGSDCTGYGVDYTFKAIWNGLENLYNGRVHNLLADLTVTNQMQADLSAKVAFDGQTVDAAVCDWLKANEAVWSPWLSEVRSNGHHNSNNKGNGHNGHNRD